MFSMLVSTAFLAILTTGASAVEWRPIECVPADPAPETLFEMVQTVDDFEAQSLKWEALHGGQNAQAKLSRDTREPHGGQSAMRVDYQFAGRKGLEYLQFNTKLELTRPELKLGFWVKTDGTAFRIRLRIVDSSGETHQFDLATVNRPGWQFATIPSQAQAGVWGGDGNHRLDYPCRLAGIVVDRPEVPYQGQGTLWIDDVTLGRPRKLAASALSVEVQNARFGNLYDVGETAALCARGQGDRIRWQVVDFWDQKVAEGEGSATGTEARFALSRTGYFTCTMELLAGGKIVECKSYPAAALPSSGPITPSDFLGMCTHFGHGSYPLDYMTLLRRYGMDQFRDEVSWGSYETARGQYQMPSHGAALLQKATQLKMRPLLIFDYANRLYDQGGFPNSPEAIAGFAAYAADLVHQTRGIVNQFEVWNEWVGGCGMHGKPGAHDGEAYGRLLKATYEAVKRTAPDVTVVGIGGEYGPKCAEMIVSAVKSAGAQSMDAWSIHPYRYPRSPEASDLVGDVRRIAEPVAQAGAKQKAWITEIGWPTHSGSNGSDERSQAILGVRALAMLQAMKLVEKVFWYDFKDDGLNRQYNENNFGVVHHQRYNGAPKPAIVAMSAFVRLTQGATCNSVWHDGDAYAVCYRFPDARQRMLAWSTTPDTRVRLTGKVAETHDLMGDVLVRRAGLVLGPAPVYLTGQDLKLERSLGVR